MNRYDFIKLITEAFGDCKTKEEIDSRAEQMIELIKAQKELSKQYLRLGIN